MSAQPGAVLRTRPARWHIGASWEPTNRLRVLTLLAAGGIILGAVMAVFGLPHADLHGPLHRYFGIMDPFCGGTRSVFYAMRGQWARSWEYNPTGIPLVVGAALLVVRHAVGTVTGHWLNPTLRLPRSFWIPLIVVGLAVLEVNQQIHAALLMVP
jgi:hypothetical protein